mgnify:CR=1 FL=1
MGGTPALGAVQTAVYARLTADATLMALISGVFDFVPDGTAFNYVTIGDATERRFDTLGLRGRDETLTLHIWGRDSATVSGFKPLQAIHSRIDTLLDEYAISVSGWNTLTLRFENATQLRMPDGYTRQIVLRYRIMVYP